MSAAHSFVRSTTLLAFFILVLPIYAKLGQIEITHDFDVRKEVEDIFIQELASTFRPGVAMDHIIKLEEELRPMFRAVPRNADNSIPQEVVRYVLNRFFMKRGWSFKGLKPSARVAGKDAEVNATSHPELRGIEEIAPNEVLLKFVEQMHGGRGISVRELAVFAASLEDLVHQETQWQHAKAMNKMSLAHKKSIGEEDINIVLTGYVLGLLNPGQAIHPTRLGLKPWKEKIKDWDNLEQWIYNETLKVRPSGPVNAEALRHISEALGNRYGSYHDKECGVLKSELLASESKQRGRVRLADLYKSSLTKADRSSHHIDYLRDLGVMDESDPNDPLVIVPNYIGSTPHCKTVSPFHAICCRSECEDLMGNLEHEIGEALATPGKVLQLISAMSSDTVVAPRRLSSTLTQRLFTIAQTHGGLVPVHGRLFAQWMHHAFPRECPFPSMVGSAIADTEEEWQQSKGRSSSLSLDEVRSHLDNQTTYSTGVAPVAEKPIQFLVDRAGVESTLPWTDVEELLIRGKSQQPPRPSTSSARRVLVFAALVTVAWAAKSMLLREDGYDSASKLV